MRIIIVFVLMSAMSFFGRAQESVTDEVSYYKGHHRSLIPWSELVEQDFLSWQLWHEQLVKNKSKTNLKKDTRDLQLRERLGFVLGCAGDCRVFRGLKYARARYLSTVREGDDIETFKDSYLWLFLLDGTLVRVAPESSLSLNEFNIGRSSVFFYARINSGNVLWWNRRDLKFEPRNKKETDTLFLPLELLEANYQEPSRNLTKLVFLKDSTRNLRKYERLNGFIESNDNFVTKKTISFIVLPNATVAGEDFVGDFIVLEHGKSYVKLRSNKELGLLENDKVSNPLSTARAFYRGFENRQTKTLSSGVWHEVDTQGQNITPLDDDRFLSMGEFPTSDIPSILTAREMWIKKYSSFLFDNKSRKVLSEQYGYRLWSDDEISQRLAFLTEYTRRVETTNLKVAEEKRASLKERKQELRDDRYDHRFYEKAMTSYFKYKEPIQLVKPRQVQLNSEKKQFWKVIHGQY